jgi:hypothetical protein
MAQTNSACLARQKGIPVASNTRLYPVKTIEILPNH